MVILLLNERYEGYDLGILDLPVSSAVQGERAEVSSFEVYCPSGTYISRSPCSESSRLGWTTIGGILIRRQTSVSWPPC